MKQISRIMERMRKDIPKEMPSTAVLQWQHSKRSFSIDNIFFNCNWFQMFGRFIKNQHKQMPLTELIELMNYF